MSQRDVEITDGDGQVTRLSCESFASAVEVALRMTHGGGADDVQVRFS